MNAIFSSLSVMALTIGCHSGNQADNPDAATSTDAAQGDALDGTNLGPGTYAYLGGTTVTIVNVTNAGAMSVPVAVNTNAADWAVLPSSDARAFATESAQGGNILATYDTSDVANVHRIGSTPLAHGLPFELRQPGRYIYVGEIMGVEIFDGATPELLVHTGKISITGAARGFALHGSYAYIASNLSGLVIADISNPAAPSVVSTTSVPGLGSDGPWSIGFDGSYAYLVCPNIGVLIFDVSDPASPIQKGTIAAPTAREVAIIGGYAFLSTLEATNGLLVADVRDVDHPAIVAMAPTQYPSFAVALDPSGTRVYVAGGDAATPPLGHSSIDVFDISTPATPVSLGSMAALKGGTYTALEIHVVP